MHYTKELFEGLETSSIFNAKYIELLNNLELAIEDLNRAFNNFKSDPGIGLLRNLRTRPNHVYIAVDELINLVSKTKKD